MLAIRRDKPCQSQYCVLPSGRVEPADASREAALRREIPERSRGNLASSACCISWKRENERQCSYRSPGKDPLPEILDYRPSVLYRGHFQTFPSQGTPVACGNLLPITSRLSCCSRDTVFALMPGVSV
jgi:hypothetical protein